MLQNLTARLSIGAALLALGAATASGAVVTRTFTLSGATIADLYSATFDAPLTPCPGVNPTQECTFFTGTTPVGRAVVVTNLGTGTGTMSVNYETTTGEITQVNSMVINLPDMSLEITKVVPPASSTTVTITNGNSLPVANDVPFIESGTGTLGRDLDGAGFQTVLGQGTADADQSPAIGQAVIFQHNNSPNVDVPDFAVFSDVVDTCVDHIGTNCSTITSGLLTLDAVKYRLEGTIGCKGAGHSLVLKSQTVNFSIYRVNFTATTTDADCDGDTVANALDNCPDVGNLDQADGDGDLRGNMCDNCRTLANNGPANNGNLFQGAQADADNDGFGNRCDADLNNNGSANAFDTSTYRAHQGVSTTPPVYDIADFNTSGGTNSFDTSTYRALQGLLGPGAGP